jgi:hypothetical protein
MEEVMRRRSSLQSFALTLEVGDQLDVIYEEAPAISVEPMWQTAHS